MSIPGLGPDLGTGGQNVLKKGVVVEVIYDPSLYDAEMQEKLIASLPTLQNPEMFAFCPRNSCIVRQFGQGKGSAYVTFLAYPFFPPHISLPLKPGESVWLISPGIGSLDQQEAYWISRITSSRIGEDLNYSHLQRKNNTVVELPSSIAVPPYGLPDFPNIGNAGSPVIVGDPEDTTQPPPNPFDKIAEESESYKNFTPQPVPKFSKRIGDLTLQGSNNTLICLGQDRGWTYTDSGIEKQTESNATFQGAEFAGTIDIVAGRSRYITSETSPWGGQYATTKDLPGSDPVGTGFRTIENFRAYVENDKNPAVNKLDPNPAVEGDPDFRVDAARIYVSQLTDGDLNFGINQDITPAIPYVPGVPFVAGTPEDPALMIPEVPSVPSVPATQATPGGAKDRMATGFEAKIEHVNDAAYVVAKADEVRLIARKQDADPAKGIPEINGSIRLVKEGKNSEDLAVVVLLPDGTIQISGSKIYLGRPGGMTALTPVGTPAGDGGRGVGPGPGGSEPYVRYSDLKALWDSFMDELSTFCDNMTGAPTPGYGSPSPAIDAAVATLKAKIGSTHKPDISTVQSERIFGE